MRILTNSLLIPLMSLLIVVTIFATPAAGYEVAAGSDIDVFIDDSDIVESDGNTVTVWSSASVTTRLGPTASRAGTHYIYCLDRDLNDGGYDCQQGVLESDEAFSYEISAGGLSTGQTNMQARIHEDGLGANNPLIEEVSFTLEVIEPSGDMDNDGLSNLEEYNSDTDYQNSDSDGDGLSDGAEVDRYNTDPENRDSDNDGLNDGAEVNEYGTDPTSQDSDNDELSDDAEVNEYNTDPTATDTDDDGLSDGEEVNEYGTDPTSQDSDNDGLTDTVEIEDHGTDPLVTDTDGDGFGDRAEVRQGSDPTDSSDTPESSEQESESTAGSTETEEDTSTSGSDQETTSTTEESQSGETTSQEDSNTESENEESVQRGFFTNNPSSGSTVLQNPFNITVIGFVLSILGIGLELRRGV